MNLNLIISFMLESKNKFRYKNLAPSIDKGSGRSLIVKKDRQTSLLVKIKGNFY
jgi:hypothetical protein